MPHERFGLRQLEWDCEITQNWVNRLLKFSTCPQFLELFNFLKENNATMITCNYYLEEAWGDKVLSDFRVKYVDLHFSLDTKNFNVQMDISHFGEQRKSISFPLSKEAWQGVKSEICKLIETDYRERNKT